MAGEPHDQDTHMDDGQIDSRRLLSSLSKHTKVEMEDVKQRYQGLLDQRNDKIKKLERKNHEYLQIICDTEPPAMPQDLVDESIELVGESLQENTALRNQIKFLQKELHDKNQELQGYERENDVQ